MSAEGWLPTLQSIRKSIESANEAAREIVRWVDQNVCADDVRPRQMPPDLEKSLVLLHDTLHRSDESLAKIQDDLCQGLHRLIRGQRLSREQFHIAMALALLNFTNKSVGLSDFDDYEIFEHFYFEDEDRSGVIDERQSPTPRQ